MKRLYYACFYAVTALLLQYGLSASSGGRSLLNRHFVRTGAIATELGLLYGDLFEGRQQGYYHDLVRFEEQQVRSWISQAQRFVARIEALLQSSPKETGEA